MMEVETVGCLLSQGMGASNVILFIQVGVNDFTKLKAVEHQAPGSLWKKYQKLLDSPGRQLCFCWRSEGEFTNVQFSSCLCYLCSK